MAPAKATQYTLLTLFSVFRQNIGCHIRWLAHVIHHRGVVQVDTSVIQADTDIVS